ncbi:MAG: pyrroline-5-carboxylate reductase [Gammaproteobacteria bacterium]|nr:pyrroline-5-carboxylate reductase [Gammaproteobacteria bacterium]
MQKTRITFLGAGNMGRSLIGGLIANGYPADLLCAADPNAQQRQGLASLFNMSVYEDNLQAVAEAEVVVLAVKPQAVHDTIVSIADKLNENNPLLISVAAGVRLSAISRSAGRALPVIRVMPNTPALIQSGAAALFANEQVKPRQLDLAEAIMRSVGIAIWLDDEAKLDAVTAVSGSGPAYFFFLMEAMEQAAIEQGIDAEQARLLVQETALGAAKMARESKFSAAELRRQVSSPGGTTESAIKLMQEADFTDLVAQAIDAAGTRSRQLADEFEKD